MRAKPKQGTEKQPKASDNHANGNGNGFHGEIVKDLGRLDVEWLKRLMCRATYAQGQIVVEEALLAEGMRISRQSAREIIHQFRGALKSWFAAIDANHYPVIGAWGGASDELTTTVPGMKDVLEEIGFIANLLVGGRNTLTGEPRECGIVHGSSITGFMGAWDRAWASARASFEKPEIPIFNIPLNWVVKEIREIPAKSGRREHRCPPQLSLMQRTEMFSYPKPKLILTAPGGLGCRFEIGWSQLSTQMREMLLTAFTGWVWVPEIILLDCWIEPEQISAEFRGRPGSDRIRSGWVLDGLRDDFVYMVATKGCKQPHISKLTILRVGEGEDVDQEDRVGPRVIYRPTPHKAAMYVSERLDFAIVRSKELEKQAAASKRRKWRRRRQRRTRRPRQAVPA